MEIRALTCDTYGTLVDWRGSILDELQALGRSRGIACDWEAFLDDWKSAYRPGMDKVNRGEWPWTTIDVIYRRRLDEALRAHAIGGLGEVDLEHLNRAWWRLRPWPDTVAGLTRLRRRYVISPLSNASFAGMVHWRASLAFRGTASSRRRMPAATSRRPRCTSPPSSCSVSPPARS